MSSAVSIPTVALPSGSVMAAGVVAVVRGVARALRRCSGGVWRVGDAELSEREFFFAMVRKQL
jgi:hypothetical protein